MPGPRVSSTSGKPLSGGSTWKPTAPPPPTLGEKRPASTGIGWATAKLLLDRGFRVFGSVRKQADADRLTHEFGANFKPLMFDVTDEAAVRRLLDELVRASEEAGIWTLQAGIFPENTSVRKLEYLLGDALAQAVGLEVDDQHLAVGQERRRAIIGRADEVAGRRPSAGCWATRRSRPRRSARRSPTPSGRSAPH